MSTINITIGQRSYPVVCADGEEAQIERLAQLIDEKYNQLGDARTPQEAQNLVFTALFLADELTEARKTGAPADQDKPGGKKAELRAEIEQLRAANDEAASQNARLQAEIAQLRDAAAPRLELPDEAGKDDDALAEKLEALAACAEAAASALESKARSG